MKDGVRLGNRYSGTGGGSRLKREYEQRGHSRVKVVGNGHCTVEGILLRSIE